MKLRLLTTSITLALSANVLAHTSAEHAVSVKSPLKTVVQTVKSAANAVKKTTVKVPHAGPQKLLPKPGAVNPNHGHHGHPTVKVDGVKGAVGNDIVEQLSNDCSVSNFAATNDIANFVASHNGDCIDQLFNVAGANAKAIFNENNMIAVANLIRTKAGSYQGDNSNNIGQLIYFLRAGLYVAYYKKDDIGIYSGKVKQSISDALDAFYANSKVFSKTDENAKVLTEAVTLIDSAELNAHFIWVVKRLLSDFDSTSQDSWYMLSATNNVFTVLFRGHQNDDFVNIIKSDRSLVDALYSFYNNKSHLIGTNADYLLNNAVKELGRFLKYDDQRSYVSARIKTVFDRYTMDGEAAALWLGAADMVNYYDKENCEYYGICGYSEVLEAQVLKYNHSCSESLKIRAQDLYSAQGQWVCDTLGTQETYFHQLLKTNHQPVFGDLNSALELVIFGSSANYKTFGNTFFGMNTDNGGMYLEGSPSVDGNQARFVAYEAEWKQPDFHVWNLQHEYVHYLDGRFNLSGNFGRSISQNTIWWIEGLAEYVSYREGYEAAVSVGRTKEFAISEIFKNNYSSGQDRVYRWGYLAVRFMFEKHSSDVDTILAYLRSDQYEEYQDFIDSIGTTYDSEWMLWLENVQVGQTGIIANGPSDDNSDGDDTTGEVDDTTDGNTDDTSSNDENDSGDVDNSGTSTTTEWRSLNANTVTVNQEQGVFNHMFFVDVPANSAKLTIKTTGGTGDADMYVKFAEYASLENFDQRPFMSGNEESVEIDSPESGRYYIGLSAYNAFNNLQLSALVEKADAEQPIPEPEEEEDQQDNTEVTLQQDPTNMALTNGVSKVAVSSANRYFSIFVPNGTKRMIVTLQGGAGDADLYINPNSWPSEANRYWVSSNRDTNNESVDVAYP
ncbi:MAG: collagenase, partial [Gammaproteobacteria bacterium]|nr:collagenase [Gammaproteobacteria bacterium]